MRTKAPSQSNETPSGRAPLQGWKDIASYLDRDARTARRWEQSSGLPVRRHGGERGSVYAYPAELDAWRSARQPRAAMDVQSPSRRGMIPLVAAVAALVAVAAVVLWGPIMPPEPLVQASEASGAVSARQVWADDKTDTSGRVSADGRYLSFTDWDTGDLALRDLETGENQLLTNKGSWSDDGSYADWNVLSPAGEQVAYAWFNKDRGLYELRIIETAGGDTAAEPRVLYAHEDVPYIQPMDWFPGRHRLLVLLARKDNFNQIVTVSVEDGSIASTWRTPSCVPWRHSCRHVFQRVRGPARYGARGHRSVWVLEAPRELWAGRHVATNGDTARLEARARRVSRSYRGGRSGRATLRRLRCGGRSST